MGDDTLSTISNTGHIAGRSYAGKSMCEVLMRSTKIAAAVFLVLSAGLANGADRFVVVRGDGVEVTAEPAGNAVFLWCRNTTNKTLSYDVTNVTLWVDGEKIAHWDDLGGQPNLAPGENQGCGNLESYKYTGNGAQVRVEASITAQ